MDASVVITSEHLPTLTFDGKGPASKPSPVVAWLMRWLKVRVQVKAWGETLLDYKPEGKPGPSTWPLYGFVFGALFLFGAFIFLRGLFKR